jgi:hypothetical protein
MHQDKVEMHHKSVMWRNCYKKALGNQYRYYIIMVEQVQIVEFFNLFLIFFTCILTKKNRRKTSMYADFQHFIMFNISPRTVIVKKDLGPVQKGAAKCSHLPGPAYTVGGSATSSLTTGCDETTSYLRKLRARDQIVWFPTPPLAPYDPCNQ